ncbi:MAG TPA: methyltransferase domain-containing protein [Rhodopila sp.]|nr:methyltransferase domain-containing protein [Rhodopila sp.]
MAEEKISFDDGGAYERSMGVWSRLAGEIFLDWLAPPRGLRWLDVGCGSGAFTELIVERCAPAEAHGIDPSDAQLAFARTRPAAGVAEFRQGDAMALPYPDDRFDAAVMALVLFFVPDPDKGVAEMARVVRPGGVVAAYLWDFEAGGFPLAPIQTGLREMGRTPVLPPSVRVSGPDALRQVWVEAGLVDIESRSISVSRSFASFEEFWSVSTAGSSMRAVIERMAPTEVAELQSRVRAHLPADAAGRITYRSLASAIKERVGA